MWFILSLVTVVCWGGSDLFFKMSSPEDDRYSHWRIVLAIGSVMGVHALVEILTGAEFHPIDLILYLPATACYIASMILGYVGLRYLMLSVSSPICNSSGAVVCLLCLLVLKQMPDLLSWAGIVLISAGVLLLAVFEGKKETVSASDAKYRKGFIAVFFPIFYCILDGLGTFADACLLDSEILTEESANIAYEITFFLMAVFAYVYLVLVRKQPLSLRRAPVKVLGAVCETGGQLAYIYAIGSNPVVVAPMVSAYFAVSVLFSRLFLKEKLSRRQYAVIVMVFVGLVLLGVSEGLAEA